MSAQDNLNGQQFFHGTRSRFYTHQVLSADEGTPNSRVQRDTVFAATDPMHAADYALGARGKGKPVVYQVEPVDTPTPDPEPDRGVDAWHAKEWRVIGVHDKATRTARQTERMRKAAKRLM